MEEEETKSQDLNETWSKHLYCFCTIIPSGRRRYWRISDVVHSQTTRFFNRVNVEQSKFESHSVIKHLAVQNLIPFLWPVCSLFGYFKNQYQSLTLYSVQKEIRFGFDFMELSTLRCKRDIIRKKLR
jgi:hypothetical protein